MHNMYMQLSEQCICPLQDFTLQHLNEVLLRFAVSCTGVTLCRYIITIDLDGSNLWRVPLVSGEPAEFDYGSGGNLIVSGNCSSYLVQVGQHVQQLDKPAPITHTGAGPCKFYPHNNRSALKTTAPMRLHLFYTGALASYAYGALMHAALDCSCHTLTIGRS